MTDTPRAARKPPELLVRAGVGFALAALGFAAVILGHWAFWLLISAMAVIMIAEWGDLFRADGRTKYAAALILFAPLSVMSPFAWGPGSFSLGILLAAAIFTGVALRPRVMAAGMLYVGLPVLSLLLIREQPQFGILYTVWAITLVSMCDIGAYFTGRLIGGPKLAPVISPNKTWAGLIGGIALASLFAAALNWQFGLAWRLTLATPVLGLLAAAGDLFESWLKRRAGMKDSGNVFPGHGGVLDRLDGLVPVAPVAAFLVVIVPQLYALWR